MQYRFEVTATVCFTVEADTPEAAEAKALKALKDADEFGGANVGIGDDGRVYVDQSYLLGTTTPDVIDVGERV